MDQVLLSESNEKSQRGIDHPSLLKRYISSLIDTIAAFIIVGLLIVVSSYINNDLVSLKIAAIAIGLSYEPLTMLFCRTLGQVIVGIRVNGTGKKNRSRRILNVYLRFAVKSFLGWLSFLTIHQDEQGRAIHDIMTDTVVVHSA